MLFKYLSIKKNRYIIQNNIFHYSPLLILCILALLTLPYCSENSSVTDVTTITDINAYIVKSDLEKGIVKTAKSISAVTFSHRIHESADVSCRECHHKKNNNERVKVCAFCHKGVTGAEAIHKNCMGCHKKTGDGPVTCDTCHGKESNILLNEDLTRKYAATEAYKQFKIHDVHKAAKVECAVCHHIHGRRDRKDTNEKCSTCHTGVSKMKILHVFCKECHLTGGRGPVSCKGCHKNSPDIAVGKDIMLPDTGHRKPPIKFSHLNHTEKYNTECIDCHHTHTYEKCMNCHKMKDQGNVINLKNAFHQQCHDCHRKTAGPQACGSCHKEVQ